MLRLHSIAVNGKRERGGSGRHPNSPFFPTRPPITLPDPPHSSPLLFQIQAATGYKAS